MDGGALVMTNGGLPPGGPHGPPLSARIFRGGVKGSPPDDAGDAGVSWAKAVSASRRYPRITGAVSTACLAASQLTGRLAGPGGEPVFDDVSHL